MDFDEATNLLLKASGANKNDQPSRDQAQPMAHLHRHIPLAIIHAGAAIRQQLYTNEKYCEAFTDRRKELLYFQDIQASADYKYTVYATWNVYADAISRGARGKAGVLQRVSANAGNALNLLTIFEFCHYDSIPEDLFLVSLGAHPSNQEETVVDV